MLHVSVIVPTYNGLDLLKKNLTSLLACLRSGDEILILDDCSNDDSVTWLVDTFSLSKDTLGSWSSSSISPTLMAAKNVKLTLVINDKNLRFAVSCNRGVRLAKNPLVFLINNDVSPESDVLDVLSKHFDDSKVFGVGCLELEDEGKLGGRNRLWFERGMFHHSRAESYKSGLTAWVSGGSGLFDRDKFLELGGFDEAFSPAYWEDVDLSFRARARGWKVQFDEKATVVHQHESTNKTILGKQNMEQVSWRNSRYFSWKNADAWQKLAFIFWTPYWCWKRLRSSRGSTT